MQDRHGSRGATTVELVVAMTIFSLLALMAARNHIALADSAGRAARSTERVAAVRLAAYSLEGQVRSGDAAMADTTGTAAAAGCSASGNSAMCLRVSSRYAGQTRCRQWQVLPDPAAAGTAYLRTRGYSPAWSTDGDVEAWRVAARGLVPATSTAQPFTLTTPAGGLTPVVQVRLVAADPDPRIGPAVVATTVTPRNLLYGLPSTACSGAAP
jgi:type II secretory pathway pseudopilin PulG